MKLTDEKLIWLAVQASTLRERLDGSFVPCEGGEADSGRRLSRLREVPPNNSSPQIALLLQQTFGLKADAENNLLALLGAVRLPDGKALPAWTLLLNDLVQCIAQDFASLDHLPRISRASSAIPYAHLYWPVVQYARARVERSNPGAHLLEPGAWQGLEAHLCRRIASVVSTALHPAFLAHRAVNASGVMGYFPVTQPTTGRKDYVEFVLEQGQEGLVPFFLRYPVAGRLVSEVTWQWIEFMGELLTRLEQDAATLSSRFNGGLPLGSVSAITAGISDSHYGGRSVLVLDFASGRKIVYKPRSLAVDRVFYGLVAALNDLHGGINLRTVEVFDRGMHGWMEFVPHAPCSTKTAAQRYYRRAGVLVCLVHWLRGIDFHRENVVAAGEHPVLVDLEALAHPVQPGEDTFVAEGTGWSLASSALRTGLLPLWHPHPVLANTRYDHCGLDAKVSQPAFYLSNLWRYVNTDRMELGFTQRSRRYVAHRPTLSGRVLTLRAFQKEVLTGYSQMAAVLEGSGRSRFAAGRRLLVGSPRRCIKRPTRVYNFLLRLSIQPQFLKTGVDRSIEMMALPYRGVSDERNWMEEVDCLEKLDVPYFQVADTQEAPPLQPSTPGADLDQVRLALQRKLVLTENRIQLLGE